MHYTNCRLAAVEAQGRKIQWRRVANHTEKLKVGEIVVRQVAEHRMVLDNRPRVTVLKGGIVRGKAEEVTFLVGHSSLNEWT